MKTISIAIFTLAICFVLTQSSCQKDATGGSAQVIVKMKGTDSTAAYNKILVEVTGLQIKTDASGWVSYNVKDTVYDLLQIQDTANAGLLGSTTVPVSSMTQLRLILGTNNNVVVNNVTYPLSVPVSDTALLTINAHQELIANRAYTVMLAFDATASVVANGGSYQLQPALSVTLVK